MGDAMPPTATATPKVSPDAVPRCSGRYSCASATAGGLKRFKHIASTITAATQSHTLPESRNEASDATMRTKQPIMRRGVGTRCDMKPAEAVATAPKIENTVISSEAESSAALNVVTK